MIKLALIFFSLAAFADEPTTPPEVERFYDAVRADKIDEVKEIIRANPDWAEGPCGNGDATSIAAEAGAIKVLRFLAKNVDHYSIECAFREAINSNQMVSVKYFTEELKVQKVPLYKVNSISNVGSTNNVEVVQYLLEHFKIDQSEIDKTYTDAVISGQPGMTELLKKNGGQFLNPAKAISLLALSKNNGSGMKRDELLTFTIATNDNVSTSSKRIMLKPQWPKKFAKSKKSCPRPILGSSEGDSEVNQYQLNDAGCEVQLRAKDRGWRATIYGASEYFENAEPVQVTSLKDRSKISIHETPDSGWWANWIENGVHYLAAFQCRKEDDMSCMNKEKVQSVIAGFQPIHSE